MASYLNKFSSTIRQKQTEQILKLLNKQRSTGQIRTVEEFTSKLEALVRALNSSNIIPTLKLFNYNPGDVIHSDTFNFSLERLEDDLTTAFGEAYNIDQVQKAHNAIVREVLLKNIDQGISELEAKVNLYEFLQGDKNGFTSAIFSTFKESKANRLARSSDIKNQILFSDPRTSTLTSSSKEDAYVDLIGERLTLGFDTKNSFSPRAVKQIFDNETTVSKFLVMRPGTKLENMIDGKNNTFWIQNVIASTTSNTTSVTTKLEFLLPGVQTINFLDIVPANVLPFTLKKIWYLSTNTITLLAEPDVKIVGRTSYMFPTVSTEKIILEFECTSKRRIAFQKAGDQLIWFANQSDTAFRQPPPSVDTIISILEDIGIAPRIIENISTRPASVIGSIGDAFEIGFDSISFGSGSYSNKSIYVSSGLELSDPLQVGLKVAELRPASTSVLDAPSMTSSTYDDQDTQFFHSSIEYWIIKRDFDTNGNILATNKIPILPTGVERVNHERLVLVERSASEKFLFDIGHLMFFADPDTSDIKVYRNGNLMTGTEWEDVSETEDRTPNSGRKMKTKIRIKSLKAGDIFTVSYDPIRSSTISVPVELIEYTTDGINIIDMVGNLSARTVHDNLVLLNKGPVPEKVAKTILYLAIVLRNNAANTLLTPAVEEYSLVIGEKNNTKFNGEAF